MSDGPFDTTAYETPDSDDTLAEVYEQNADNIAWEQTDTTMADTNSAELWDASLEADGQSWDAWRAGNEANANAEEARMAGDTDGYDPEWVEQVLAWLPPGYDPAAFSVDDVNAALAAGPLPEFSDLPPLLMQLVVKAGPFAGTRLLNLVKDVVFDEPLPNAVLQACAW